MSAPESRPGREARAARGRALRRAVPRSSHAELDLRGRPDPIDLLEQQAASRLPELMAIRYGRMVASPLGFFRGAALVMAADLARTPATGLQVQICGDAHLLNFGVFATPEQRLVFDVNDFDETCPGPWEWDVKRLAASLAVAGRANGLGAARRRAVVCAGVRAYRRAMRRLAALDDLAVWYAQLPVDRVLRDLQRGPERARVRRAETDPAAENERAGLRALRDLTRVVDGRRQLVSEPPLIVPFRELLPRDGTGDEPRVRVQGLVSSYLRTLESDRRVLLERFEAVDAARKVVGIGSVGTRDWIVLLQGADGDEPVFLQLKEAQASVVAQGTARDATANQGQRVVEGQRLMQAASDIFLGWTELACPDGTMRDFYVRQLKDSRFAPEPRRMTPKVLRRYGEACNRALARAHARSGERMALAAYLGGSDAFDRAVGRFAEAYADQNERDHAALRLAVATGRVAAHDETRR